MGQESSVQFSATFTLEPSPLCILRVAPGHKTLWPMVRTDSHLLHKPPNFPSRDSTCPSLGGVPLMHLVVCVRANTAEFCTGGRQLRDSGALLASLSTFRPHPTAPHLVGGRRPGKSHGH